MEMMKKNETITSIELVKKINELSQKIACNNIMTAKERQEYLSKLINSDDVKVSDKLKALDILNKMDGEYIEKMQLSGQVNTNPLSGLTTEELRTLAGGKNG